MRCTACKKSGLKPVMTEKGVLVDYCPSCRGVWLDRGEIFFFTKKPALLKKEIEDALARPVPSVRKNPKTGNPLVELSLFSGSLVIDYCPKTAGIWLDAGELKAVASLSGSGISIALDSGQVKEASNPAPGIKQPAPAQGVIPSFFIPNLGFVSAMTLFGLYAMLTLILFALVYFNIVGADTALYIGIGVALFQFLLSPFILDLTLGWFYHVEWVGVDGLPKGLADFIRATCRKENINVPRVGLIPDGSPNAFTYGHVPNNARMVLTRGILNLLNDEETEAVAAHEIGHIVHWDFLVMTIAYLVPLFLYYIYRVLIRIKTGKNDKSATYRIAIAVSSYILYIISEYVVLYFSRVREYFADRFSGTATGNPAALASALVKIGYGLAGRAKSDDDKRDSSPDTVRALGIFDASAARALAVSTYAPGSMGGEVDKETLKNSMKWDLWNPWAAFYELSSTHPLIAKRILSLSRQSQIMGREPYITFTEKKPESYWDEFLTDLFISWLPGIASLGCLAAYFALGQNQLYLRMIVLAFGLGYLARTFFSYSSSFYAEMSVSSLLKKIKVSAIRPVSCSLTGKIIGRGVPGLIWSEDFVLQDETGILYLDYNQPLAIWNFFFGLLRSGNYIGKKVTVRGWYRRSPIPYIEIKELIVGTESSTCYTYAFKLFVGFVIIAAGIFLLLPYFGLGVQY